MVVRQVLSNGVTLLTERMPEMRSAAVGVWLRRGSRHETAQQSGLYHFIEHMLFKGTKSRSAEQIAAEVDAIGGHMDAFTAKEYAAFHLKVLGEQLPLAMDILGDLVQNPLFDEADIAKEKKVIFEEMAMVEDTPDDIVMEMFSSTFWPDNPLGRPILGTRETVGSFGQGELLRFFRSAFNPANLVVAAAGRVEHAAARALVERHFGALERGRPGAPARRPKVARSVVARSKKQLEQVHVCVGAPSCRQSDPARFALYVMNTVLGGSMSSRLFQNIREKRGLVYSISSGVSAYADTGVFTIYAATSLDSVREVLRLTVDEVRRMVGERLPDEELRRAKEHIKGSLLLSLEGTVSRMSHLVRQELYLGRQMSLDEIAEGIDAVTADDVQRVARRYLSGQLAASVIGSLHGYRPKAKDLVV